MLVMSLMNVSMAQNHVKDSLTVVLKEQTYKEVRKDIESVINTSKQIDLKIQLGELMREARKPKNDE